MASDSHDYTWLPKLLCFVVAGVLGVLAITFEAFVHPDPTHMPDAPPILRLYTMHPVSIWVFFRFAGIAFVFGYLTRMPLWLIGVSMVITGPVAIIAWLGHGPIGNLWPIALGVFAAYIAFMAVLACSGAYLGRKLRKAR